MARRRRKRRAPRRRAARVRTRSYSRPKRRRRSYSGGGKKALMGKFIGAGIYGAVRERGSNMLAPVSTRFGGFLGPLADEATMAFVLYQIRKRVRNPTVKNIADQGLTIEFARIGEYLAQTGVGGLLSSNGGMTQTTTLF